MFWPRNWRLSQNPNDQPLQILSIHSIWPRVANDVRYRNRNLRKSVTRTIFTLLLENIENIVWNTSQSDCITFAYANDHNIIRGWLCCWRRCIRNFRNNDSRYFWVSNVTVSNVPTVSICLCFVCWKTKDCENIKRSNVCYFDIVRLGGFRLAMLLVDEWKKIQYTI